MAIAGHGNDSLWGGAGGDILIGGLGADQLSGGDAGDVLAGGAGSDLIEGGAGGDILIGDQADAATAWAFAGLDATSANAEEAAIAALYAEAQLWGIV